jgi:hypothetical protein
VGTSWWPLPAATTEPLSLPVLLPTLSCFMEITAWAGDPALFCCIAARLHAELSTRWHRRGFAGRILPQCAVGHPGNGFGIVLYTLLTIGCQNLMTFQVGTCRHCQSPPLLIWQFALEKTHCCWEGY